MKSLIKPTQTASSKHSFRGDTTLGKWLHHSWAEGVFCGSNCSQAVSWSLTCSFTPHEIDVCLIFFSQSQSPHSAPDWWMVSLLRKWWVVSPSLIHTPGTAEMRAVALIIFTVRCYCVCLEKDVPDEKKIVYKLCQLSLYNGQCVYSDFWKPDLCG